MMEELRKNKYSPVVLFCYNRPRHVEQTLEALSRNVYADESILYIFCDGPKETASDEQIRQIEETRFVIRKKRWCKNVYIIESEKNKGLANSVIEGVSKVIAEFGTAIVLEDDLITSPYFLKYMNGALDFYKKYVSVFSISADRPPVNKMAIPNDYIYDTFVSLRFYSYGWATWIDRWNMVNWSLDYVDNFIINKEQVLSFNRGGDDLTNMLLLQRDHKIDSWAIRFCFAHFCNHAVSIMPNVPYVDNIGFDNSGVHCTSGVSDYRNDISKAIENPKFIDILYEDRRIINAFYNFYTTIKRPLWQRACNYICRKLGVSPLFIIKKAVYCDK